MDIQTITVVITGISIIIGVILSLNSRKQELETRQAQLFMEINNRWNQRDFAQAYLMFRYGYEWKGKDEEDIMAFFDMHEARGREAWIDWQTLAAYFEGIGVLVRKGLLNIDLVEDLFSGRIIAVWEKFSIG